MRHPLATSRLLTYHNFSIMTTTYLTLITILLWLSCGTDGAHTVNRMNYGLVYSPAGDLQLVSQKWLHSYRLKVPQKVSFDIPQIKTCQKPSQRQTQNEDADHNTCIKEADLGARPSQRCSSITASMKYYSYAKCRAKQHYHNILKEIISDYQEVHTKTIDQANTIFQAVSNRHKRALIDISGIFSKLFGFGRQKDIDQVQAAVQQLHDNYKQLAISSQKNLCTYEISFRYI